MSGIKPEYELLDDEPVPTEYRSLANRWGFDVMKIKQCIVVDASEFGTPLRQAANYYKRTHPGWTYRTKWERRPDGSCVVKLWRLS